MLTVEWAGLEALQRALERVRAQALPALGRALAREGDAILEQSQDLVPVLTRALQNSAMRIGPEQSGFTVEVELRYGRFGEVPYAQVQHEDTTYHHPHGGQSHYLSQPLLAATDGMPQRLGETLWSALRP